MVVARGQEEKRIIVYGYKVLVLKKVLKIVVKTAQNLNILDALN